MKVAFKWVLENEYSFEKQREGGRGEGILGEGSSRHKTMEIGELKLCLRMISNPYIRRLPQCPAHKSKPRSAGTYWKCLAVKKPNTSHNPPTQF